MRSKEEARQYMQAWLTAFPDMHVRRTNRVVSDDAVGTELEFSSHPDVAEMMGQLGMMSG